MIRFFMWVPLGLPISTLQPFLPGGPPGIIDEGQDERSEEKRVEVGRVPEREE
jgi:hypothetical protein